MRKETREKFSSQANPTILANLRNIAEQEGRQFQAVLDEAMSDYIEKKKGAKPRKKVLDALEDSIGEYDYLYDMLAK